MAHNCFPKGQPNGGAPLQHHGPHRPNGGDKPIINPPDATYGPQLLSKRTTQRWRTSTTSRPAPTKRRRQANHQPPRRNLWPTIAFQKDNPTVAHLYNITARTDQTAETSQSSTPQTQLMAHNCFPKGQPNGGAPLQHHGPHRPNGGDKPIINPPDATYGPQLLSKRTTQRWRTSTTS